MNYLQRFAVVPGAKVKLKEIDPSFTDSHESHKAATEEIAHFQERLRVPRGGGSVAASNRPDSPDPIFRRRHGSPTCLSVFRSQSLRPHKGLLL